MMMRLALFIFLVASPEPVVAYDIDQILPFHTARDCECAPWASQAFAALMFSDQQAREAAESHCAMPARQPQPDLSMPIYETQSGWCFCKDADPDRWFTFCDSPSSVPSQINLLIVNASSVVVNFVTNDNGTTADSVAQAELRPFASATMMSFTGFSHRYVNPSGGRVLSYHSVALGGLSERTRYEYRVRAARGGTWSDWHNFTSLYSSGVTKFALYADMGIFANEAASFLPKPARQNLGNLDTDLRRGLIDFAVHSGDHAYEFPVDGGARGDGYMDAYSKFLSHAPWAPGWGNHEYLEGDQGFRLANITAGMVREMRDSQSARDHHRMHYSFDVGLVHVVQLDLSPYWCRSVPNCIAVDTCGVPEEYVTNASEVHDPEERYDYPQLRSRLLEFVRKDLAEVNRARTPWVIVTAHYPMYQTYDPSHPANLASDAKEPDGGARTRLRQNSTSVLSAALAIADLEPMLKEFHVNIYMAGHNHNYETTWPMYNNTVQQKSYHLPQAPVHVVSGAAGPPETSYFLPTNKTPSWSRMSSRFLMPSYSRVTVFDHRTLQYEQIANDNGTVIDSFTITRSTE